MDQTNQEFIDKMTALTGKTYEDFQKLLLESQLTKHTDIRKLFMTSLDLSYGFANTLALILRKADGASLAEGKSTEDLLTEIYSDKKENLRPIHDLIISGIEKIGDFEILPKKGYLSLKCRRQFAMIGPKTNTRIEIGINGKDISDDERLISQKKGSMCNYIVKISSIEEVDDTLFEWIKKAYDQAQ